LKKGEWWVRGGVKKGNKFGLLGGDSKGLMGEGVSWGRGQNEKVTLPGLVKQFEIHLKWEWGTSVGENRKRCR